MATRVASAMANAMQGANGKAMAPKHGPLLSSPLPVAQVSCGGCDSGQFQSVTVSYAFLGLEPIA